MILTRTNTAKHGRTVTLSETDDWRPGVGVSWAPGVAGSARVGFMVGTDVTGRRLSVGLTLAEAKRLLEMLAEKVAVGERGEAGATFDKA